MNSLDREVAEALGNTFVHVDYSLSVDATDWQKENERWMEDNNLDSVGDYFVNVEKNYWIAVEDWHPSTNGAQAWELMKRFRINVAQTDNKVYAYFGSSIAMGNNPEEAVCRVVIAMCKERENARD